MIQAEKVFLNSKRKKVLSKIFLKRPPFKPNNFKIQNESDNPHLLLAIISCGAKIFQIQEVKLVVTWYNTPPRPLSRGPYQLLMPLSMCGRKNGNETTKKQNKKSKNKKSPHVLRLPKIRLPIPPEFLGFRSKYSF